MYKTIKTELDASVFVEKLCKATELEHRFCMRSSKISVHEFLITHGHFSGALTALHAAGFIDPRAYTAWMNKAVTMLDVLSAHLPD
jgi:hypothetical protein